jgi:pyrimidine and pyridine-specific 5'-nucleotidase
MTTPTQALKTAHLSDPSKCYFIDDSLNNVKGAKALGWGRCVHYDEFRSDPVDTASKDDIVTIRDLEKLRKVWPEVFKT